MKAKLRLYVIFSLTAFVFFTGCAHRAYEKAAERDTIDGYNEFLKEYRDSKYASEAIKRIENLTWDKSCRLNTIEAYNNYLSKYPSGNYLYEARAAIREIEEEIRYGEEVERKIRYSDSALQQALILSNVPKKYKRLKRNQFLAKYFNVFDGLRLAKCDIVVTRETSDCTKIPILGTLCTDYLYAGKVLRNDVIFLDGDGRGIRTIHKEKDLTNFERNSGGNREMKKWSGLIDGEAFGETKHFKRESKLSDDDLYHTDFSVRLPTEYYPTSFSNESSSSHGGILGFIQEHPILSLVVGAAVAKAIDNRSASTSSSSSSSPPSSYSSEREAKESHNKICEGIKQSCYARCEGLSWTDGGYFHSSRTKCSIKCDDAYIGCKK